MKSTFVRVGEDQETQYNPELELPEKTTSQREGDELSAQHIPPPSLAELSEKTQWLILGFDLQQ